MRMIISGALSLVLVLLAAASSPAQSGDRPPAQPPAAETEKKATLNLNTATQQQLEALPGIGPKTAERILEFRQKNGAFKKVEELMNIKGIGEKGFLKIKPLISVAPLPSRATGGMYRDPGVMWPRVVPR
ncbi:MAG: helix-hairpin-helix domain-containing protein [Vicinamibacterales bacterium]